MWQALIWLASGRLACLHLVHDPLGLEHPDYLGKLRVKIDDGGKRQNEPTCRHRPSRWSCCRLRIVEAVHVKFKFTTWSFHHQSSTGVGICLRNLRAIDM